MYWITGILGLALIAAPFAFGFSDINAALWTSVIIGTLVFVVSAVEAFRTTDLWEYWVASIFGILAISAPFVLGFSDNTAALWSSVVIGLAVVVVSGARLLQPRTS